MAADPITRATNVKGPTAAARLRDDFEFELAMSDPDSGRERELVEAVDVVERRFPNLPPVGDAEEFADERRRTRFSSSTSPGRPGTSRVEREAREAARRSSPTRSTSSGRPSPGPRRRSKSTLLGRTGLAGAGSSATSLALQLAGITLGLAALYLILTNAQRAGRNSVVDVATQGFTKAVHRIVAPVDPIAARTAPAPRRPGRKPQP